MQATNQLNTFTGGLDKDTSNIKVSNDKYFHLQNFKIVTDEGTSSAAIENDKGTRLDFTIPDTQGVYEIYLELGDFTLNNTTFTIGVNTTIDSLFDEITAVFENDLGVDFNIYAFDDRILVFGLNDLTIESVVEGLIVTIVEPLESPKIIHVDSFNDKLVIWTTVNNGFTNLGDQIWVVEYNEETNEVFDLTNGFLTPQYHLKYNNLLNLSMDTYIRRSHCRYENSRTMRAYFTDWNNPIRSINLLDPDAYALLPSDLDFVSNVTLNQPIILDVDSGGFIPVGSMVQVGYILEASGKETLISPLSPLVPIYESDDESASFASIEGSNQATTDSKQLLYKVTDIDTEYDIIKHVAIVYEFQNQPLITIFKTESVPSGGEVIVTFTNDEEAIALTEVELNKLTAQFDTCKDFVPKQNRLVVVNTKSTKFEITDAQFDSRSYRFNSTPECVIEDKLGNTYTVDPLTWLIDGELEYEHDAINPSNNASTQEYKYQSDGATLGGEGKYISYEFVTKQILVDQNFSSTNVPYASPVNREEIVDYPYEFANQFNHFKSPFIHMLYAGYMRDEIYRFAIVFKNLKGNPSFAKWIGDIRFPTIQELPLQELVNGKLYANQLGIKFTVNIPDEVDELISGYEIVRVERAVKDRTRLTGGLFLPLLEDGDDIKGDSGIFTNSPYETLNPARLLGFLSPYHQFRTYTNPVFKAGDYLKFETYYDNTTDDTYSDANGNGTAISFNKLLEPFNYANSPTNDILGIRWVGRGSSFDITTSLDDTSAFDDYFNTTIAQDRKLGEKYIFAVTDNIQDMGITIDSVTPYLTYCRDLAKQYGGNSFDERTTNVYMATKYIVSGEPQEIFEVWGGDTFCNFFDYETVQNNDVNDDDEKDSFGVFFVCESPFNVDLRHGNHFNDNRENPNIDLDAFLAYTKEQYFINPVYLQENNVKQIYVPKPFNFVAEDEQPYSIWVSELKVNGEELDSWVKFKINNHIDVEGIYGGINGVINQNGKILFFQDSAIGVVPINERAVVSNEDGIELTLGTGDVISDYGYISTKTGCFHTSAIIQSEDYAYFISALKKKLYRISVNTKQPLSDIKGLASYLNTYIKGSLLENVDEKTNLIATGIHGVYDHRYSRVLFTLNKGNGITFSFNELTNSFEEFPTFTPSIYHNTGRKIVVVNGSPLSNRSKLYQTEEGDYGVFFDEAPADSYIQFVVNGQNGLNKVFNSLLWYSQSFNSDDTDNPTNTFDSIRVFNDYQDTGEVALSGASIRRIVREWSHSILRDINSEDQKARIINPWTYIKLTKSNNNNKRFICHDIVTYYMV